jgi:hypothetical protein
MKRMNPHLVGVVFAAFLAIWHLLWCLLVAVGAAQAVIDFIFRLHMITPPYRVDAFNLGTAVGLVLVTASIGYIGGLALGMVWKHFVPQPVHAETFCA